MANDFWLPTSADLRRQCTAKILEAEKDFWMTISEMHFGMLESMWEAAKKGEPITMRRNGEKVTLTPAECNATPSVPGASAPAQRHRE